MDTPLNDKIERTLKRKAARKKNDSNYMPVLSLHQQVLALVSEANSKVSQERHVTPRSALTVMNRSLASLSSLDSDAKDFAVLREVSRFLNVATKTFTASQTHNTDLLVAGHPLSTLNASLSGEEFLKKNARWIAADPSIDESIRPLVASAHAATPGSIEREHAFARLNANKTLLAAYFKIDSLSPIIAAFGSGNSSAARRARVALQWRDRKGRWVEMGRGADFNFRMPDGSVARASGVYVGVRPQRAGENFTAGLIQVSGDKNLPDGIYAVRAGDVETYAARLTPAQLKKAGVSSKVKVDQNQVNIPTRDNLVAERLDAPTGWTKVDDNTFTSDDNYTAKLTDGKYTLYRQNEDGSLADKVGDAGNWADVNDLANGDQEAYDAVKGQDSSAQQQQIKARLDGRTAHNAEFDRLEELVKSGVDQNGNTVPPGWEGVVKPGRAADVQRRDIGADIVYAEEGLPSVEYRKKIADDNGDPVFAEAEFYRDGTFAAYDKKYDSWEEADADIPRWIKEEEDKRGRSLEPIANVPSTEVTGKEIYERRIATGDSLDKVAKDLGIPREEVRRLEAEYGRSIDSSEPFDVETAIDDAMKALPKSLLEKVVPASEDDAYRWSESERTEHTDAGSYFSTFSQIASEFFNLFNRDRDTSSFEEDMADILNRRSTGYKPVFTEEAASRIKNAILKKYEDVKTNKISDEEFVESLPAILVNAPSGTNVNIKNFYAYGDDLRLSQGTYRLYYEIENEINGWAFNQAAGKEHEIDFAKAKDVIISTSFHAATLEVSNRVRREGLAALDDLKNNKISKQQFMSTVADAILGKDNAGAPIRPTMSRENIAPFLTRWIDDKKDDGYNLGYVRPKIAPDPDGNTDAVYKPIKLALHYPDGTFASDSERNKIVNRLLDIPGINIVGLDKSSGPLDEDASIFDRMLSLLHSDSVEITLDSAMLRQAELDSLIEKSGTSEIRDTQLAFSPFGPIVQVKPGVTRTVKAYSTEDTEKILDEIFQENGFRSAEAERRTAARVADADAVEKYDDEIRAKAIAKIHKLAEVTDETNDEGRYFFDYELGEDSILYEYSDNGPSGENGKTLLENMKIIVKELKEVGASIRLVNRAGGTAGALGERPKSYRITFDDPMKVADIAATFAQTYVVNHGSWKSSNADDTVKYAIEDIAQQIQEKELASLPSDDSGTSPNDENGEGPEKSSSGRTPDLLTEDDAKQLNNLVDNTYSVDALDSDYELYKDKNGDLTLRARVEDGTDGGVVLSGFTYIDVANISDDGKVTWKNDDVREEHQDNFVASIDSMLFWHDLNDGRARPKDFIYFDGETGETIDTLLTDNTEGTKEYFGNLVEKVHAAGGSIEDEELSSKELKSLLNRPSGSIFRVFLPKDISDSQLTDIVTAGSWDSTDEEDIKDYVESIKKQRDNSGPDEPSTPPSGGTPPKTPSPNVPSAPGLFNGFNVPDGAFKFNTVDYTPEGRIDEASNDFTDDPQKLATKFTPQELVQALSQALLGNSTDAALAEILNANVDDDNDILDPAEIQDSVNIPQVNLGVPSGAGQLEFNAGAEFVPAEALFNAIWEAGLDPNRVVANIYDSVNGNNENLNKLIDAQGGVPSQEEAQLVDDIVQEIRQLKDASEPGDSPVANEKQTPSPDPLPGSLIENIPIDFDNPDYYIPNTEAYVPSQPEVDENGYTDNPEILSADYEVADLIEQMLSGITDGSGAALLAFDNVTVEVPIEAMRDAIQYQDINTNQILLDLKKESNDMSEPDSKAPRLQAHSQMIKDLVEQTGNTLDDDTADKIRDAIDEKGLLDWSEADDAEIIEAITEVAGPGLLGQETPQSESPVSPTPSAEVAIDSPEAETPQFNYPGPRENGYSANNIILDSNRVAVGAGSRIQALSDGRAGTIVAVQNIDTKTGRDADYARIRFDDGTTAVRSARQIFGIDAGAPVAQGEGPGQLPPARRNPVPQDPAVRLNEPAPQGIPVIAGNGDIPGVMLADTPQDLVEFTNPDAKQSDYAVWGLRAPEIARAGRDRATIKNIEDLVVKTEEARTAARNASTADERDKADAEVSLYYTQLKKLVRDTFGIRAGVALGSSNYTIKEEANVSFSMYNSGEVSVGISFRILDSNGTDIGQGSRSLRRANVEQPDGITVQEWSVSNDILVIEDNSKKQSGFAAAYNRYMEDWYIANGFKKIKVHAAAGARWQGGLVWALNGFIWDGPSQASRVPAILRKMLNDARTTEEEKKIIKDMQQKMAELNPTGKYTPGTVPTPLEIALIGSSQGASKGSSWAGKRAMSALDWYGVKNLDPAAIEQRQAVNYDQMRNARKRIAGNVNRPNVSRELVLKANSNEFADANPELRPYIDYIRDVLRSNRSLAVLSPGAKTALNRFTASQLMKGEDRTLSLEDIIKLRIALDAEFKADNPLSASSDFGVGNQLLDVSMDDVRKNNVPGFTIKELGVYESGVNDTYMVTHNDSGQIFFLKKDAYASMYSINGPGAEIQADTMLRASGVVAGYETRVSNVDPEVLVMQRAGVGVPLLGEPMTASNALYKMSIDLPDGTTVKVNPQNFMDLLHTPEDAIRVMLVDLIISNVDRHNGNLLIAIDGTDTGKIRILPIDHALSSFSPDVERIQDTVLQVFNEGNDNLYGMAMPVLTKRLKQQELLALFRNEANNMMEALSNPANLPTGKELDLIISNFGSLDAYRQKIQERIDSLLKPNGEGYKTLLNVLKPSYWSQR